MNLKRFTGRNAKEVMTKVREAFGRDAVVVSTRPHPKGIEIVAMPPDTVASLERWDTRTAGLDSDPHAQRLTIEAADEPRYRSDIDPVLEIRPLPVSADSVVEPPRIIPPAAGEVQQDVEKLAMSTLSFQDYVRERMLKRRKAALKQEEQSQRDKAAPVPPTADALEKRLSERHAPAPTGAESLRPIPSSLGTHRPSPTRQEQAAPAAPTQTDLPLHRPRTASPAIEPQRHDPSHLSTRLQAQEAPQGTLHTLSQGHGDAQNAMLREIRAMKGLIEDRFGALAFIEKLQLSPTHARLTQKLLDQGFTPALIRKMAEGMGADVSDEMAWAAQALERNLLTDESDGFVEDSGGIYALIGSTGVGKTTSTAKIAAAFASRHGANHLGLITLDAYRVAAHEQLRAYGRILGVPVHTAHDRAALEDLLDLLSSKKMILVDTAGIAQRDARTKDLLDMLTHPSIRKLVVINAAAQGETIDDVLLAYRASSAHGVVLSKVDEAVKLGPAVDAMVRHRLKVRGIANGQRVPEDWHHLSANALVHRALRSTGSSRAFRMEANEVSLVFTTPPPDATGSSTSRAL